MKNNNLIITILVAILVAGGAFFGGMKYQQSKQATFTRQFGGAQGMNRNGQVQGQAQVNRQGFRPLAGEIISSDDKSITVKLPDGSSKIVLLSDSTTINKADTATKDDLKTGTKVAIFGQTNSDGSVAAQNIQLNPVLREQR
jgi:hypothetical protein